MYGGIWWAALTYAGSDFEEADLGLFEGTIGFLDSCYDEAVGYAGAWYAGIVYAGTPICIEDLGFFELPTPQSNVQNLCIIRCN